MFFGLRPTRVSSYPNPGTSLIKWQITTAANIYALTNLSLLPRCATLITRHMCSARADASETGSAPGLRLLGRISLRLLS